MPHITIEHSDNLIFGNDWKKLLSDCHDILVTELPTTLSSCRSRIISTQYYYVADGQKPNAYIAITIKALAGRSDEALTKAGKLIFTHVLSYVKDLNPHADIECSVEMADLAPIYIKQV
jgi:5-carboxymethyl-2-hydroxymuconate isomerase